MGTARIIELEGTGGEARFRDAARQYVALRTPTGLAGNFFLELPDADGGVGEVLSTDGAGKLSWVAAGAAITGGGNAGRVTRWTGAAAIGDSGIRDDGAGRLGVNKAAAATAVLLMEDLATAVDVIRVDLSAAAPGAGLLVNQAANHNGITIVKTGVLGGSPLHVTNPGTAPAIGVVNNGIGAGVLVTQNTAAPGVSVSNLSTDAGVLVSVAGAAGIGVSIGVDASADHALLIDAAAGHANRVVEVINAGDGDGLVILSTGDGAGIVIDQTADRHGINIDHSGNNVALEINHSDAACVNDAVVIVDGTLGKVFNVTKTGTDNMLYADHNSPDTCIVLAVQGGGGGISIVQDGNARGIYIDQNGNSGALYIDHDGDFDVLTIDKQAGTGKGLEVIQANTDAAIWARQSGNGICAYLEGQGSGNVIDIVNSGTGLDIDGNSSNWNVRPGGGAMFEGLTMQTLVGKTISAGAIAVDEDECRIYLNAETGVADTLGTITGGRNGQIIILSSATSDTITVTDGVLAGKIHLEGGAKTLQSTATTNQYDLLMLIKWGDDWNQLSYNQNTT